MDKRSHQKNMSVIVTGVAGFIGMHVAERLLHAGHQVVGIDNLNPYYDPALKRARLARLTPFGNFSFVEEDIANAAAIADIFDQHRPDKVINLAAQAGVRYSLEQPFSYSNSNLVGFLSILEACRKSGVSHLVYASSSSVYGLNEKTPFAEADRTDSPASLYAATKKSNELMAFSYSHLYGMRTTGLRYFTVYGPWGRPDMSPWLFTEAIMAGKPIKVFNHGDMYRDFTFIDDIADATVKLLDAAGAPGHTIYNVGNNRPERLMDFIGLLENVLGKTAEKIFLPMQAGDVHSTMADVSRLYEHIGFRPTTPLQQGLREWVAWYREYHQRP